MFHFPFEAPEHVARSISQSIARSRADIESLDVAERVPSATVVTHDVFVMKRSPCGELPLGFACRGVWSAFEGSSTGIVIERPVTAGEWRARRAAERRAVEAREAEKRLQAQTQERERKQKLEAAEIRQSAKGRWNLFR